MVGNEFVRPQIKPNFHPVMAQAMPTAVPLTFEPVTNYQRLPLAKRFESVTKVVRPTIIGFSIAFLILGSIGIPLTEKYLSASQGPSPSALVPTTPAATKIAGLNQVVPAAAIGATIAKISDQSITISFGTDTVTLSPATIKGWLSTKADTGTSNSIVSVNRTTVATSMAQLATSYTKATVNQLTVTHNGQSRIIVAGSNGSRVGDMGSLIKQLSLNLLSGNGMQLAAPLTSVPFQAVTPVYFDKLIEVDLTNKIMYLYQNGQQVQTYLVTAGAPATPTPVGEFHIWDKLSVQNMSGFNPNGTKYFQPNVEWVNYFDHSGDAIHGNYWRPLSYFGHINSSHGCVAVTDDEAAWIYNWAPIGTTIVTYN